MKSFPIEVPKETRNAINLGPYEFDDVHAYQVTFKSDPELVASLVPEPLQPNRSGHVSLVVAQYLGGVTTPEETLPGYNEIVIGVPSKYRMPGGDEVKGIYMVQLYLADRTPQSGCDPTILGMVVPGYPKRICDWQELVQGNARHIRIAKRNVDVVGLRITDAPLQPVELKPASGYSFVLKYIPSGSRGPMRGRVEAELAEGHPRSSRRWPRSKVGFDGDSIRLDSGVQLPVKEIVTRMRCMMKMVPLGTTELIDYLHGPEWRT